MASLHSLDVAHGIADEHADASAGERIGLPVIGARTPLVDVLHLLGHGAENPFAAMKHAFTNRRVHRGHSLLLSGQPFENLYLVLAGSFKSTLNEIDGTQQIVAFPMRGDLIGLDAFAGERYPVTVTALEEAHVTVLPRCELIDLAASCPDFEAALRKAVSLEFLRTYQAMRAMGALGAEARLARFLYDMGQRMARFGLSPRAFRLPMARADIASYLGLSIETVSRAFTSLAARGIIDVDRHNVNVTEPERLGHPEEFEPHSLQLHIHEHGVQRRHREVAEPALH
jgi:CRP/FNR family transcriptional regulator